MIVELDGDRLRCGGCAYEWTPPVDGERPKVCTQCMRCRDCEAVASPGHACMGLTPTRPERTRANLEGLPTELIDAIRESAPDG